VSRPLQPPADAFTTALPDLSLSSVLAAIFSTSLAAQLRAYPRTTFLLPTNGAFRRLGALVADHLLRPGNKADLEQLVLHHVLSGVQYAAALVNGSAGSFATLEGSDVRVERWPNGSVALEGSGGWPRAPARLAPRNLLTQTGVVHTLDDVLLPRSIAITPGALARAARASAMLGLVARANMSWVLDGADPPADSDWARRGLRGAQLTLLCPTDDAFRDVNLTALHADAAAVRRLVEQHLIPAGAPGGAPGALELLTGSAPLALADHAAYSTVRSADSAYGDVEFLADPAENGRFLVGIRGAQGTGGAADWAHVLAWGRSTARAGGVVLLDGALLPYAPPWWRAAGAPLLGGALGVAAILAFFWAIRRVWMRDTTEATYEPVSAADDD
jgi:solute carrier family 25 carnitine/acylcarnitine transporter 20/29